MFVRYSSVHTFDNRSLNNNVWQPTQTSLLLCRRRVLETSVRCPSVAHPLLLLLLRLQLSASHVLLVRADWRGCARGRLHHCQMHSRLTNTTANTPPPSANTTHTVPPQFLISWRTDIQRNTWGRFTLNFSPISRCDPFPFIVRVSPKTVLV